MLPEDAVMLLSLVNMRLRDKYADMDALCEDMDADRAEIDAKLAKIGYTYDRSTNQYK